MPADITTSADRFVHVGRQPLYDRDAGIAGYELLFRDASGATAATMSGSDATSRVIVTAFTQFGLRQLVGDRLGFVNLTREFLVGELAVPFEPAQAVLEVLETVEVDAEVLAGVAALAADGYAIALDDFEFGSGHELLLPVASYVKLEVAGVPSDLVATAVQRCREHPVTLVAERLETEEDLRLARELGFDLFQGYLLGRPQVLSAASMSPSRMRRLELLGYLSEPEMDLDRVTEVITVDPALSYPMLRAASSAAAGQRDGVSSVAEALILLGTDRLVQWLSLLAISDLAAPAEPHLVPILARARLCQVLAEEGGHDGSLAFTAGMLVGVGDLLDVPVAELAGQLPLSAAMERALVAGTGPVGRVLAAVREYEEGEPPTADLAQAYLAALDWAMRTFRTLLG